MVATKVGGIVDWLYLPPLIVLFVLSLAGIWSQLLNDNLLQRMGLAAICFGSILSICTIFDGGALENLRLILTYGCAIFAIGVAAKLYKRVK